ncbi:hypothetical protein Spith_1457 [Spirochaeta thermophila DSM 6578]|uniref:Serine/threonine specific protein phosphatases domain-containing protein n=1 Tax=Winmispira thermophila (strain ATCC 700085 / DSM 6578 / Z-1203) TaxID=869211 RepID=G0GA33_WINT7|nr:metallophosphoesterase [Spirochaeta thermophila]AEJ61721.1 hypothetical protein Spith_1457 [Spirochaeta thermophila DSM 6578]
MSLLDVLDQIRVRDGLPERDAYLALVEESLSLLEGEPPVYRPRDVEGRSGGLVYLDPELPTVIVPDLHARYDFFHALMHARLLGAGRVGEMLEEGRIQVLCLGDGFHSERRGRERWKEAFDEYATAFRVRKAMDEEMKESFALMEMVMRCKLAAPRCFHFLKGNHENILNEEGEGNHPFRKYAFEGEMVREYVLRFYGEDFLHTYARFEKALPLLAVGGRFLASHAEPAEVYDEEVVINMRLYPEVIYGLTWTDNEAADEGSVEGMLAHYLPDVPDAVYFGGHRPVSGAYMERAGGRYIQVHNPSRWGVAVVMPDRAFDPETDLVDIQ